LALQVGHRKSIDLDFFGPFNFEREDLSNILKPFGQVEPISITKNINLFLINGIKVDFVNYKYNWLKAPVVQDSLCLAAPEDIAAMKPEAVFGRGTKKDFTDIYFLLKLFSLSEMLCL